MSESSLVFEKKKKILMRPNRTLIVTGFGHNINAKELGMLFER